MAKASGPLLFLIAAGLGIAAVSLVLQMKDSPSANNKLPKKKGVTHYDIVGISQYGGPHTIEALDKQSDLEGVSVKALDGGMIQVKGGFYSMKTFKVGDTYEGAGIPIKLIKVTPHKLT